MLNYSQTMARALTSVGLKNSEEPLLDPPANAAYLTWRNTGETTVYASGKAYRRRSNMEVTLFALPGGGWQAWADSVARALTAAGFYGVRRASEMWDDEIKRRLVTLFCYTEGASE